MNIPTIDWALLGPVGIVFTTGVVLLITEMLRPKKNNNVVVGLGLVGLLLAGISLVSQLGGPASETFDGMVLADSFGLFAQLVIVIATGLTFLFSEGYLREKRIAYAEFYCMALWSAGGGMIMVATNSLLMMFIGLEVLSIALYVLAGMARGDRRSEESALKYFLLGAFASSFMLYGIAFAYGASGSINIDAFALGMRNSAEPYVIFSVALLLVGLGFKAALVPFHQWTPDVYQGAPTNVTAFMSVVSKVAAVGALARVLGASVDIQAVWFPALSLMAILTMTIGNVVALTQKDVKRALAYSSVAHAGYILVGLLAHFKAPDRVTLASVLIYLAAYTAMTIGAFAMVALTARAGKEGTRTQDLNGMWRKAPFAATVLFICLASLIGVPPTAGFFGKWAIFMDAMSAGLITLAIALAINSAISTYYYWQIAKAAFVDDDPLIETEFAPVSGGYKVTGLICIAAILGFIALIGPIADISSDTTTVLPPITQDPVGVDQPGMTETNLPTPNSRI